MESVLSEVVKEDEETEAPYTPEEEEEIKRRLEALRYIWAPSRSTCESRTPLSDPYFSIFLTSKKMQGFSSPRLVVLASQTHLRL